jgi:hypothetical protein
MCKSGVSYFAVGSISDYANVLFCAAALLTVTFSACKRWEVQSSIIAIDIIRPATKLPSIDFPCEHLRNNRVRACGRNLRRGQVREQIDQFASCAVASQVEPFQCEHKNCYRQRSHLFFAARNHCIS